MSQGPAAARCNPEKAGPENALDLDQFFRDEYPGLYRYCHRLTGDRDAAEDVAQEAFVRLWDREVQGPRPALRAWLFKVATHLIRDRVRTTDNRRRLLEIHPVRPGGLEAPDRLAERSEASVRVREVLDDLSQRDRSLLLMREEGFSYKEMAEAVDVATGSVGTLLARALTRFSREYRNRYDVDEAS